MQNHNTVTNPLTNHLLKSNGIDLTPIDPENDFRGLNPTYLKKEGEKAYFAAGLQTVLAVHLSCFSIAWLAFDGLYIDGAVCGFIASCLWAKVITNVRYAFNCNLEADTDESEENTKNKEREASSSSDCLQ
jgi:hypothetical protein